MESICGANCSECELFQNKKCMGCCNTNGCPFGKKCWVAKYIQAGGKENFDLFKKKIIEEIHTFPIEGMANIDDLYPLHGSFVNLEYTLPNGIKVKFLKDEEIYLGNQVECVFSDEELKKCYGIVSNMDFILICEYEENGMNPELLYYWKR